MSKPNATARRTRVARNIYHRPTGVFEVGFKDGAGMQRWRTVAGGITAARALSDKLLAARGRGERVAPNPRLRFGEALERWLTGMWSIFGRRPATCIATPSSATAPALRDAATRRDHTGRPRATCAGTPQRRSV